MRWCSICCVVFVVDVQRVGCSGSIFFFSSRRRHTRGALVTGVQTCALPIWLHHWPKRSEGDKTVTHEPPYDPRGVANLLLDLAEVRQKPISNLVLQKLLYFAHGRFLIESKKPLLAGYFEAWQFGPVHPTVYHAFKAATDRPIGFRAIHVDKIGSASCRERVCQYV